ncbi:MAG: hypothetical protein ACP5VE_00795 [Chthonomonadales bacterium]
MDPRNIWHWVLLAVGIYLVIGLLSWLFHMVMYLLHFAIVVLIVVGVVYLLTNMFGRRSIT